MVGLRIELAAVAASPERLLLRLSCVVPGAADRDVFSSWSIKSQYVTTIASEFLDGTTADPILSLLKNAAASHSMMTEVNSSLVILLDPLKVQRQDQQGICRDESEAYLLLGLLRQMTTSLHLERH